MSEYYSTQETLEAKARASRVRLWADKDGDGSIDTISLTQALKYAKGFILSYVYDRYGSQVNDWDSDTAPDLICSLSDDLALFYLASGNNALNEIIRNNYSIAITFLVAIRDYQMTLPGVDDSGDYDSYTDDRDSIFVEDEDEVEEAWS